MHMIDEVVRQFRNGLTDLVRELDGTGLRPTTFVGFVGKLKALINEVGLLAFVETVLRHASWRLELSRPSGCYIIITSACSPLPN